MQQNIDDVSLHTFCNEESGLMLVDLGSNTGIQYRGC